MSTLAAPIRPDQIPALAGPNVHIMPLGIEQYHEMIRTGILPEGSPIELIDGVLVVTDRSERGKPLMSIGPLHAAVVENIADLRARLIALGFDVRSQQPIALPPRSEPEPDGAIIRGPRSRYTTTLPTVDDVCCVIEVADSSLEYDRTTKLTLYASAGIPQYVIVNLNEQRIEVHATPDIAAGTYAERRVVARDGSFALMLVDGKTLTVDAALLLPA